MEINDFKDTVELDNVTRRFLDLLKEDMQVHDTDELDDITVLRFAVLLTFRLGRAEHSEIVSSALGHALTLAKRDPADVECALFRDNGGQDE